MEIALNLTFDDNATPAEQAAALQLAATFACARLRTLPEPMAVDQQIDLDLAEGPLQNAALNRFC